MGKPKRLARERYVGKVPVFITCVSHERHAAFADSEVCRNVLQLLRRETTDRIEHTAFCLMPDHGHLLLTGCCDDSNLLRAAARWKQATGHQYPKLRGRKMWQGNFWDWILRDGEDVLAVTRYVVSDPVRSGLVANVLDYPWWGSDRWTREALAENIWDATAPRWWKEWN